MNRPEVKIIEFQQEEIKPADISQNEADMLLSKYGYRPTIQDNNLPIDNGLTFEEMVKRKEEKEKLEKYNQYMKSNGPKPITFGGNYDSEINYGSDDSGYTFKVSVVSDMPIPKKY